VKKYSKFIGHYILIGLVVGLSLGLFNLLQDLYYAAYISLNGYAVFSVILVAATVYFMYRRFKILKSLKREDLRKILTQRELEVYGLLVQEKTNSQIADELYIEESTLKSHINRIYKKLEVKNRRSLIARNQSVV
jgi:DNA-binding CsgD family transcriptional regulator